MKTIFKKLTTGLLAVMFLLVVQGGTALAATSVKDGNYTIGIKAINTTTGEKSHADSALTKPAKLEVKDGKIFVILEVQNGMNEVGVEKSGGSFQKASVLSKNSKSITYKFPVSNIDNPALMETTVEAMGMKVNFKLVFDASTLKETASSSTTNNSKDSTKTETKNEAKTESTTKKSTTKTSTTKASSNSEAVAVSNPKTEDNSFAVLYGVILAAAVITVGIFGANKLRNNNR